MACVEVEMVDEVFREKKCGAEPRLTEGTVRVTALKQIAVRRGRIEKKKKSLKKKVNKKAHQMIE